MSGGKVQWYWNASQDPFNNNIQADWRKYSDSDNQIIEESYQQKQKKAPLAHHDVHFNDMMQVSKTDFNRQRQVKRVENP